MRINKAVYIEWIDSTGPAGWQLKDSVDNETDLCRTIGFLVTEDSKAVTISASESEHAVHGPLTIPKFAIRKRRVIRLPK